MAYVLRGEGPERDAFRLVYKRRLENLGLKLRNPGPDVEARSALSQWPKAELLVNEISHLHQERSELRREKQQLQKRGLSQAQLVESQLEVAKQRSQQSRERRDALKKLASSGPAVVSKGDILQAEQNISKKVEALRRETEELAQRRQELFAELQSQSLTQQQGLVTSELRQLSAQQAQSCSLQVELKVLRDKLRRSEREREDLHLKHAELTAQFQTALAVARKEVSDMSARLKQELLQEDDVADCLGEAAERLQVRMDAATASRSRCSLPALSEPSEAPKSSAHLNVAASLLSGEDELKSNLSSALRQIGDLKQRVHELQAEKAGLHGRLKHQQCRNRLRKISGLMKRQQARAAMSRASQSLAPYKEDMEEVKRLLAMPVATSSTSATSATCATSVVQRVLEAFNEEVPCHSVDLASLLMGADDAYVVSAVMQLIQSEVKRQARAIHSSLTASRVSGGGRLSGAMEEVVGRLQQMQKQLLLEVVSSTEDEDDEIWDLELHLALLVGRRDEVLQAQDGTQRAQRDGAA